MRNSRIAVAFLLLLFALSACDGAGVTSTVAPTNKDALLILNRSDNIDPALYDTFTQETGIPVTEATYDDDAELPIELNAPTSHFDVLIASDRNVAALRRDNKLSALNLAQITNFQDVEPRLKNPPFDPNNQVSVPYVWGTIGLLFRTDKLQSVDSWAVLFDPARNAGKATLLDDPRLGIGTGLKWLGYSLNSTSQIELERARTLLLKQRSTTRIDSAAWADALLTGEVSVTQARSNDAAFAQSTNAKLRYAIPREGASLWMDNLVVPANSTHQPQAESFINFVLRADNAALIAAHTFALSPVPTAYDKMEASKAALFRSGYIPDDATVKQSEFVADVGAAQTEYERIWIELSK